MATAVLPNDDEYEGDYDFDDDYDCRYKRFIDYD